MTEDYAELQHAIERAGFFTTFKPIEEPGDRIVCASHQYPPGHERRGLHGNSFWVALRGKALYVASWAPHIYCVGSPQRLTELCIRLLKRDGGSAYWDFGEDVRRDFGLVEVSEEQFGRAAGDSGVTHE